MDPETGMHRSGKQCLEPVSQLHEFELPRVRRAIEWIAHDDLAQFRGRVHVAKQAIEQVEEALQVVVGIARRAGAKSLKQAFSPGGRQGG